MSKTYDVKTVVLRKNIELEDAIEIVESKKTKPFKSLLSRPKKEQVHIHSVKLYYECILMVSGKYIADYYRKATHTISVPSNVKEVELGDGVFQIRSKSGLKKAFVGKRGKNKIDMKLEEHVFVEEEDEIAFDHHGREIKFPFKVNSKTVENYPKRLLQKNEPNVKRPEMTYDAALEKLQSRLKKPLEADVRELSEEFVLRDISELYVPVFEARLIGPKKKVGIIRIDAVRKKIL
ncbi:hypothetical protein AAA799E16_00701 [Marine Group I thaumarchaeote SCGC AAA799-E16]|uniref:Uncharacterized protein n=4 Tax=Marine Group I TaxID=905826 RepID=A0A081RN86_9ARCH|nr:hypothetical protein AAA799N04_00856 [Marine Group I thaumarchaeote SCGC AAA799-N04]KER06642.1 hypothetical protein AAA799E16_00701 [Marine Group I thaumarchaeote SCGC AAA799-E16]KFM16045.1 hypothetical protein AAA799D11_00844 [Marine Group I thaumarchaeote SCGC AAA799-D11]KFM17782.1 hypothetical protein SCCGRSA3_01722 [Marine Group I thaumarchaeote SCGC RSA3]